MASVFKAPGSGEWLGSLVRGLEGIIEDKGQIGREDVGWPHERGFKAYGSLCLLNGFNISKITTSFYSLIH